MGTTCVSFALIATHALDFPHVNDLQQNIKKVPIELEPTALNERHAFGAKQAAKMTQQAQRHEETGLVEQQQAEAPGTPKLKDKQVRTAREEGCSTCTTRLTWSLRFVSCRVVGAGAEAGDESGYESPTNIQRYSVI